MDRWVVGGVKNVYCVEDEHVNGSEGGEKEEGEGGGCVENGPFLHPRVSWREKGVDMVMDVVGVCVESLKEKIEAARYPFTRSCLYMTNTTSRHIFFTS